MLRPVTYITITQVPTEDFPSRKNSIFFDFVHEFTASDTWDSLTNKATLIFPKNIRYVNQFNAIQTLEGTNRNLGGFSDTTPIFLRGDTVKIEAGYRYFDSAGNEKTDTSIRFSGFISKVTSKKPVELECEDNMWKLKQFQARGGNNNYFSASKYTVESMVRELITNAGLPYTVNTLTSTSIGNFIIQNETICQVLERLQKEFHFRAYFKGNELRVGSFVYIESDAVLQKFAFQYNIISDELDYQRKDDIVLSAVASNTIEEDTGKTTKDGFEKTKKVKLQVLVTFRGGSDTPTVYIADKTHPIPENLEGERRTLFFLGAKTHAELANLAINELKTYYYTGFRGKFTSFGEPFVREGDNAMITDPILPERNGTYKIKAVETTGGVAGLRQKITLDYKINI